MIDFGNVFQQPVHHFVLDMDHAGSMKTGDGQLFTDVGKQLAKIGRAHV